MEPLMNAPQWFLEREDSVELIGLLKVTYNDPVKNLNKFTYIIHFLTPIVVIVA